MGFRTIVVTQQCKLDYRGNHMRRRCDGDIQSVFLEEVDTLIIESVAVTITSYLLQELIRRKIKVIFCDTKHNPTGELIPYAGAFDAARKIRNQMKWDQDHTDAVWQKIIIQKIYMQAIVLEDFNSPEAAAAVLNMADNLDTDNVLIQEAHAARMYFSTLFGSSFSRRSNDDFINWPLNYAYTIVLSAINRHISAAGYLPLLGIFHHGPENESNLGSDLIEPLRPIIDKWIIEKDFEHFDSQAKREIVEILNQQVLIDDTKQYLSNAIEIYVRSVFRALNEPESINKMKFCSLILKEDEG